MGRLGTHYRPNAVEGLAFLEVSLEQEVEFARLKEGKRVRAEKAEDFTELTAGGVGVCQ